MSLYGHTSIEDGLEGLDMDSVIEAFIFDDLNRMSEEKYNSFKETAQFEALLERQVLNKPAVMRLDKKSDMVRRVRLMCYMLAKKDNNPHFAKCKKYRALWKAERAAIFKKYAMTATRLAKVSQKEYLKRVKKEKATPEQKRVENAKQN